jgi:hypothetical protein
MLSIPILGPLRHTHEHDVHHRTPDAREDALMTNAPVATMPAILLKASINDSLEKI